MDVESVQNIEGSPCTRVLYGNVAWYGTTIPIAVIHDKHRAHIGIRI